MGLRVAVLGLVGIALGLSACGDGAFSPQARGGDLIQKVDAAVRSGDQEKARKALGKRPLPSIGIYDPTDPQYCTEASIQARWDVTAYTLAETLANHAASDPVTRYAVFKRDARRELESQDTIQAGGLCVVSQATLSSAYDGARHPIAFAAETVIDELQSAAKQARPGLDLEKAASEALATEALGSERQRAEICQRSRAGSKVANVTPAIARTEALIAESCGAAK